MDYEGYFDLIKAGRNEEAQSLKQISRGHPRNKGHNK